MARTTYILLFGRLTERWAVLLSVERKSKTCTIFIARLIELPLHTISCAEFPQMCWVVCWNLYISEIPHRLLLVYTARRRTSRMTSQNRELPNRSRFYYRHRRRRQWARGRGRRRRRGELGESSQVKHSVCGCCGGARCCRTIFSSYTTCLNIDFFFSFASPHSRKCYFWQWNENFVCWLVVLCARCVREVFGGSAGDENEKVQALLLWRNLKFL